MKASADLAVDINTPTHAAEPVPYYRLTGLLVVALLPALFWTGLSYLIGSALGYSLSYTFLFGTAAVIALFLGAIYAAVASGSSRK
ncbi:MAG: hypothetical protein K0U74_06140 [Alphaproteobacteria bacterium]|nr:hypothetical protein [Alphaproteobacteria bacterium]